MKGDKNGKEIMDKKRAEGMRTIISMIDDYLNECKTIESYCGKRNLSEEDCLALQEIRGLARLLPRDKFEKDSISKRWEKSEELRIEARKNPNNRHVRVRLKIAEDAGYRNRIISIYKEMEEERIF